MTTAPALKTRRLALRGPDAQDLDALAGYYEDSAHFDNIGGRCPTAAQARERAALLLIEAADSWPGHGYGPFVILRGRGLIGLTGFRPPPVDAPEGVNAPQLIFGIAATAQRRGYAVEATHAALDWLFAGGRWATVQAATTRGNQAATAALGKLGFVAPKPVRLYGAALTLYRRDATPQDIGAALN